MEKKNLATQLLIFLLLCAVNPILSKAQCNPNNFTVTVTPGTCPANGNISVTLPGNPPCNGWQAVLTSPVGLETIQNIPSNGEPINFSSLAPGDYNVRLVYGATVLQNPDNPITVTTSYRVMNISSTSQAPSCPIAAVPSTPDGSLDISINSGGIGPFLYEANSGFGLQTFGPTTNTSHVFGNMEGGETVSFTVTDLGCGVSQTQNPDISINEDLESMFFASIFKRKCVPNCSIYDATFGTIMYSQNLVNTIQLPGNATISINGGQPQDLIVADINDVSVADGFLVSFTYPPGIAGNDTYVLTFNDGCSTFGYSNTTLPIADDLLELDTMYTTDPDTCTAVHKVAIKSAVRREGETYQMFCIENKIAIEQETAPGVWTNVPLVGGIGNPLNLTDFLPYYELPGSGHYRIIAEDDCHTIIKEFDTLEETNPLNAFEILPASSILEGTGAMVLARIPDNTGSNSLERIPSTTYQISPVPFTSSIAINPMHPYSLGGMYTLNFPVSYTTTINKIIIGDLPPGEYEILATDTCGNQATKRYTIRETATYAPFIQTSTGCINSGRVTYDLGTSYVARSFFEGAKVELFTNNGSGGLGTLVEGDILPHGYKGEFNNLSDGDYILRFTGINFDSPINEITFSSTTLSNLDREYSIPFTIEPFERITAATAGAFCDLNDPSTGIVLAEIKGGTPTYPMIYELFEASNLDVPVQTYTETDTSIPHHLFENVSSGNYLVRIKTPCDGIDLNINLVPAPIKATITSDNPILCAPGGDVELSIDLAVGLFDIIWVDDQGNTVGTGSSVTVPVTTPTTYTVNYSFIPAFCPSASMNVDTVNIDFFPEFMQIGQESTTCNSSGADYTLTVEIAGTPPYTVNGTGAPGTFMGNIWTSDPIPAGTDYNISFEDANTCTTLTVSDVAPVCCIFQVTCPTFPTTTVECYDDLPSATSLTEAEFEALGNADGSIGNVPCGIIEITAVNDANTGDCDIVVTRTYTVTEYEDTNANGIRDAGENTVLNTLDCQQIITIEDTIPPTFVESLPLDMTVSCDAIPAAAVLNSIDNCDSNVSIAFDEQIIGQDPTYPINYTIVRTWTATDNCDNETTHVQTITVEDTQAPVFVQNLPASITTTCDTIPGIVTLTALDNCDPNVQVSFTEKITNDADCVWGYTITRKWIAEDRSGNGTDHTQIITIPGTGPITVGDYDEEVTIMCGQEIPEISNLVFMGGCGDYVVNFMEETLLSDTTDDFIIERLWEVTDSCDNVELFQQIIIVVQPEKENVNIEICIEDDAIDLIDSLPGDFDTNGVFAVVSGNGILNGSLFDPLNFGIGEHQISYGSVEGSCKYFVDFTIVVDADCIPCGATEIEISETITANSDGVNDFFEITGVELCDYIFEVQIFNRWGVIVYQSNDYGNDWGGFSPNNSFGTSNTLPSGTYYYIITVKNRELLKPIDGFIYLGAD
ncbi:gliding motility-associated C-terminal domain-containing protein [Ulvibacterium sp.]|uniref:gliding motility-associated C-terminal domain-containing protein n=1 Tax=Ulvibacterium sp. TaxID=2665914 RepID=UPI003BACBA4C